MSAGAIDGQRGADADAGDHEALLAVEAIGEDPTQIILQQAEHEVVAARQAMRNRSEQLRAQASLRSRRKLAVQSCTLSSRTVAISFW